MAWTPEWSGQYAANRRRGPRIGYAEAYPDGRVPDVDEEAGVADVGALYRAMAAEIRRPGITARMRAVGRAG